MRCGAYPRIETGIYERLALEDRRCFICINQVKDEEHALLHCPLYQEIRQIFFKKKKKRCIMLILYKKKKGTEKLCFIVSNSDDYMQSLSRRNLLYKYSDDIYVQCFKSL